MSLPMPMPPPLLHTRSGNEHYERPQTPTGNAFTTPVHTPQGSPSKKQVPPGANELPNVFDNAMKLAPGSPTKQQGFSPGKQDANGDPFADPNSSYFGRSESPTRQSNKENAPAGFGKDPGHSHAALSRREQYQAPAESKRNVATRGLTAEEMQKLQNPRIKRLANVTQLCMSISIVKIHSLTIDADFLDHYFDLLSYVHNRQSREAAFKTAYPAPPETPQEIYDPAVSKYLGRERANLRKRRTRLRHGDFQILTQVGQGGYGQVYLAQKKDTKEVCALKVMRKKLLFKLDEVRHILTERDILTAAKSDWLVKLLYSFQDDEQIYLAMEYVPGGDFRTLLNNTGVLHNRHARFYIAEMFMCVDALHTLGLYSS